MRTLLVTGPGGAGRTTVAAATALAAARQGTRTLLLATDPTDTVGGVLGTGTAPGLTVLRLDPTARFATDLLAAQQRATSMLDLLGADRFDADELTPLPGSTELALLRALRDAATGPHDLVVVDLPATEAALAALALPERLRRYLRRLLPQQRQAARALRPLLGRLTGAPLPTEGLYETAARWDVELAMVQSVIEDPTTSVRLVAEPGEAGGEAVRTAALGLALYGLRMEALVANRLLPDSAGPWLDRLAAQQRKTVDDWAATYGPRDDRHLPGHPDARLYGVGHLGHEPRGADDLAALAAAPPRYPVDPLVPPLVPVPPAGAQRTAAWPVTDRRAADGVLVWHVPLPGARRGELDLVRRGDELVVTAGPFRRIVDLPSALRRCTVDGAGLTDGELCVRFRPDPTLWPNHG